MSSITSKEARQIAAEAYIFAYPMLMAFRAIYLGGIDESSPFYRAPFNQIVHDIRPADHTREDVVTMNGDTTYSTFGLDLSAVPVLNNEWWTKSSFGLCQPGRWVTRRTQRR